MSAKEIPFSLTGVIPLVWQIDQTSVANALAGTKKSDFKNTLNKYYSIVQAKTVMRPFWKSSFPASPKDISITVEGQKSKP
jgi:hypothetical protein